MTTASHPAVPVHYETNGPVALLTINRPQSRNALDGATADALLDAFGRFVADDTAAVLVLTGQGDEAFSAGADLKAAKEVLGRNDRAEGPLGFTRLPSPKPTIAAISGWCLGGGLELALWCDLRVASRSSQFGCAQRRFGAPLIDGGTQRLPRAIGFSRALELVITGRIISAAEAHDIGLVTEVTEPGAHLRRALELAQSIAGLPQTALLADRRSVIEGAERPLGEGLTIEASYGGTAIEAALEGAAAFASGAGRGGRPVA
jgi:enoyl-CoA hydratase/carnithine racemase